MDGFTPYVNGLGHTLHTCQTCGTTQNPQTHVPGSAACAEAAALKEESRWEPE